MIFDNRDIVTKLNIRRYLVLLAYLICMGLLILADIFGETILGITKSLYILVITLMYILYVVYAYLMDYKFFSFSDEGDKLTFKFISMRPFDNKKQAIEILKTDFRSYQIKSIFLKIKQDLILSVKTKNGVANYPPISITALSSKHKKRLINSLNQFV